MSHKNFIDEPPIDPLADTNPSLTVKQVQLEHQASSGWRRTAGIITLLGAAVLTVATALILISPPATPDNPIATLAPGEIPTIALQPTAQATDTTPLPAQPNNSGLVPTVSAQTISSLLSAPIAPVAQNVSIQVVRNIYNPFTIIPDRPRNEVIQYTAVQGDTIYTIADRYKLKPETIAWSNPRSYIEVLHPGDPINVPPVDGVYIQVVGSKTIAELAKFYKVDDPNIVIDSEYNNLFGVSPDTILPNGTWLFIPGGQGEDITWNPGVTVDTSGGKTQGFVTQFAPGQAGSCPQEPNPGGTVWTDPLPGSTFVRGFSSIHSGVDLAAPTGTAVRAANGGVVIYAGWNTWGYGNTIVLAHGPFLTLYGHLSAINVRCGQMVSSGSVIGAVGTTGNSTGPHLHFEIRYGQTPTDPLSTMPGLGT